jgi:indole-3-glycerol phosphate synthase
VQASVAWRRPEGALGTLVESARRRVEALRGTSEGGSGPRTAPGFATALRSGSSVALIAEIKRRSPSKGDINPSIDAGERARAYATAGAAALSVLTEPTQFGGSLADLDAAGVAGLPMLRKDFIVDRLQLAEARDHGAAAVLLIAKALAPAHLAELHAEATAMGLDVLVEVHDENELQLAIDGRYPIIGVNNRDLESLVIDDAVGARLVPLIPGETIAIYESGIRSRADVERAATLGADAVLVGTALSSASDPSQGAQNLIAVPRQNRRAS